MIESSVGLESSWFVVSAGDGGGAVLCVGSEIFLRGLPRGFLTTGGGGVVSSIVCVFLGGRPRFFFSGSTTFLLTLFTIFSSSIISLITDWIFDIDNDDSYSSFDNSILIFLV